MLNVCYVFLNIFHISTFSKSQRFSKFLKVLNIPKDFRNFPSFVTKRLLSLRIFKDFWKFSKLEPETLSQKLVSDPVKRKKNWARRAQIRARASESGPLLQSGDSTCDLVEKKGKIKSFIIKSRYQKYKSFQFALQLFLIFHFSKNFPSILHFDCFFTEIAPLLETEKFLN